MQGRQGRQDKARKAGKARQGKARQGKARQTARQGRQTDRWADSRQSVTKVKGLSINVTHPHFVLDQGWNVLFGDILGASLFEKILLLEL